VCIWGFRLEAPFFMPYSISISVYINSQIAPVFMDTQMDLTIVKLYKMLLEGYDMIYVGWV